ncbi:cell division protein FtsQ/DivIB [Thermaurantiacus sp.]
MNRPLFDRSSARRARPDPVRVAIAPRRLWHLLFVAFGGLVAAAITVWLFVLGVPQRALYAAAVASADLGLGVRQVEIEGDQRQDRLSIYRELLSGGTDSMFLLDLEDMRARLAALPWVLEADVRRVWPDTLRVILVERTPAALWQESGRYRLLDASGTLLPMLPREELAGLPLLVGRDADRAAATFLRLMARHPELASQLAGAVRVGGRRWDLWLQSGEQIALPEDARAAAALARFAAANAAQPLLGRGFARFDLRIEDQMVVRLTPEARLAAEARRRETAEATT